METTLHISNENRELLAVLRQHNGEPMSYKELSEVGFDLSDISLHPIKHLIRIEGCNKENYRHSITSNGIGFLEENEEKNRNSKFSNRLSITAICISAFTALTAIGSLIVSIIALCT